MNRASAISGAGGVASCNVTPQAAQNRAPGSAAAPQRGQAGPLGVTPTRFPHAGQNGSPGCTTLPHVGQLPAERRGPVLDRSDAELDGSVTLKKLGWRFANLHAAKKAVNQTKLT